MSLVTEGVVVGVERERREERGDEEVGRVELDAERLNDTACGWREEETGDVREGSVVGREGDDWVIGRGGGVGSDDSGSSELICVKSEGRDTCTCTYMYIRIYLYIQYIHTCIHVQNNVYVLHVHCIYKCIRQRTYMYNTNIMYMYMIYQRSP